METIIRRLRLREDRIALTSLSPQNLLIPANSNQHSVIFT
ncbi:Uncharacterised protein [Bordetella pertussis]|nr:Uncharacterised protein [Bordetella pertussis]